MQHKHQNDIVNALYKLTKANPLPIDENDVRLATKYLEEKRRIEQADAAREAKRAAKREEKRLGGGVLAV